MRHIFDQYQQPENRLTHALLSCLNADPKLLRRFLYWVGSRPSGPVKRLVVEEQILPGENEVSEADAEKRGLPDGLIHDDENWCLIIESKVAAPLTAHQLRRHLATIQRRGFSDVSLLTLTVRDPRRGTLGANRRWTEVYRWMRSQKQSAWAAEMASYMEVAETRMVADGYLREGTLTDFTGIPFGREHPYSYREAKRLLKLAMVELRKRKDLQKKLGMDPGLEGRSAITGSDQPVVWDFLRLRESRKKSATMYPHLTIGLWWNKVDGVISIPNGVKTELRKRVLALGEKGFADLMEKVCKRLMRSLGDVEGAVPFMEIVQRRYRTQRSRPYVDARLEFDLRTAFQEYAQPRGRGRVPRIRHQPQWLSAFYDALSNKHSNLQVGIGGSFPYVWCESVKEPDILDHVAASWMSCKPLLDVMFGRKH